MIEELSGPVKIIANNFIIKGNILLDLVQSLPEPAHIKDAKTGKYIVSNKSNLEIYGLNDISQILGKTVRDLDSFMKPYWGSTFARRISDLDNKVCKYKKLIREIDRIFIAKSGLIHVQDMTKAPVFKEQKVSAIFTHSHDKTKDVDLFRLFDIYLGKYESKLEARQYFCKYLKIDSFFYELPSVAEIRFLLYGRNYNSINEIANRMNRSKATIESHISHVNTKIRHNGVRYTDVLEFIRESRAPNLKLL